MLPAIAELRIPFLGLSPDSPIEIVAIMPRLVMPQRATMQGNGDNQEMGKSARDTQDAGQCSLRALA
jgi:hypothetical protein